jgi:hypothetical protein
MFVCHGILFSSVLFFAFCRDVYFMGSILVMCVPIARVCGLEATLKTVLCEWIRLS